MPDSFAFDTTALERSLAEHAARLKVNAAVEELRLAEAVAHRAREIAAPHRKTGAEEASIVVTRGDDGVEVHAKSFREFGTSKMKPDPFMRPALAEAPQHFRPPDFH